MTVVLFILAILMMIVMPIGAGFLMFLVSRSWIFAAFTSALMAILEISEVINDGEPMFE